MIAQHVLHACKSCLRACSIGNASADMLKAKPWQAEVVHNLILLAVMKYRKIGIIEIGRPADALVQGEGQS